MVRCADHRGRRGGQGSGVGQGSCWATVRRVASRDAVARTRRTPGRNAARLRAGSRTRTASDWGRYPLRRPDCRTSGFDPRADTAPVNVEFAQPAGAADAGTAAALLPGLGAGQAWYIVGMSACGYGAATGGSLGQLAWPGGAKPVVKVGGDAAVLVVPVNSSEFVGPAGEANLADVSWIGPRAAAHERILREALKHGPVMPCRFGTLLADDAAVLRLANERAPELLAFTELTMGADEYGVRIVFDRPAAMKAFMQETNPGGGSGAAYLMRRKREQDAAAKLVPWLNKQVQEGAAGLLLQAPPWLRGMVPGRARKAEGSMEPLLAIAALVDRSAIGEFDQAVDALASHIEPLGCHIELLGPMPAYSFAGAGAA